MNLRSKTVELFIPDGLSEEDALMRTTHLGAGAHPDDLEMMAIDGILSCFQQEERWFSGVVLTHGAGAPRSGLYQGYTDEEMTAVRIHEQKKAAIMGEYSTLVLLGYPSVVVKDRSREGPVKDLQQIFEAASPEVIYTHNLLDKHPTHVATALRVIEALRLSPATQHTPKLYGCEVWRDLDWVLDEDKVIFDCSHHENLQEDLLGVFDSQICGGKRYDLATMGRRRAHATYFESHGVDTAAGLTFAMDLTPLIEDPSLDIQRYIQGFIDRFAQDVHVMLDSLQ